MGVIEILLRIDFDITARCVDVRETLAKQGAIVVGSTPEEFNAILRAERAKWGTVAKAAGIKWGE